jgi:hypothetical protein
MATDRVFIESVTELVREINACVRRGFLTGPLAEQISITINEIGGTPTVPLSPQRVPKRFAVLRNFNLHTGEPIMAVQGIRGDMGTKCPVEFDNIAGTAVPEPTGTPVLTVTGNVATVALNTDGSSVDIFPVQPPVVGTPFTVTYTLGAIVFTQDFQINADVNATQGHFVTTNDSDIPLPPATPAPTPAVTPTP